MFGIIRDIISKPSAETRCLPNPRFCFRSLQTDNRYNLKFASYRSLCNDHRIWLLHGLAKPDLFKTSQAGLLNSLQVLIKITQVFLLFVRKARHIINETFHECPKYEWRTRWMLRVNNRCSSYQMGHVTIRTIAVIREKLWAIDARVWQEWSKN